MLWFGISINPELKLLRPFPRSQEEVRKYRVRYYGMIMHHDHHIGRILDRLEQPGAPRVRETLESVKLHEAVTAAY